MKVTILGSSSATPALDRHPSAQILSVSDHLYLIDCGEGTLFRLNAFKIRKQKIRAIFISHLHGDHFYGLIGLLTTMSMHERTESLTIVSPPGLREIIDLQCSISKTMIRYDIHYIELTDNDTSDIVYEDNHVCVTAIPLVHKIQTSGYRFDQKFAERTVSREKLALYALSPQEIGTIMSQHQIEKDGKTISIEDISIVNQKSVSYAYISDTMYSESYLEDIEQVDLLYHEATFLSAERARADHTQHSTAAEAAAAASAAKVKKLIIGHFSARYTDLSRHLAEAKTIFAETALAIEGQEFTID